jgi:hypothetical protein
VTLSARAVGAGLLVTLAAMSGACSFNTPLGPTSSVGSSAGVGGAPGTTGAAGVSGTSGAAGAGATPLPIPSAEALARVAAVLWQQPPDRAGSGLATTADLANVVRVMLADERASVGVGAFYRWWLDLDQIATLTKDPVLFPAFTLALRADMVAETLEFALNTTLANADDTLQTLMLANWSFVNARLADVYGLVGVMGDQLQRVALPADQRAGLLTQPALQALASMPTRNRPSNRGVYVLEKFFCEVPPGPGGGLVSGLDPIPPGQTVRQVLAASTGRAGCESCHALFDPPGLAFESFDAIGRWRSVDNGVPVDTSNLTITVNPQNLTNGGDQVTVNGPIELAKVAASSKAVQDCFVRQWLSFALGRDLTNAARDLTAADQASLADIGGAFASSGFSIQALITAVLTSDAFLAPR